VGAERDHDKTLAEEPLGRAGRGTVSQLLQLIRLVLFFFFDQRLLQLGARIWRPYRWWWTCRLVQNTGFVAELESWRRDSASEPAVKCSQLGLGRVMGRVRQAPVTALWMESWLKGEGWNHGPRRRRFAERALLRSRLGLLHRCETWACSRFSFSNL